MSRLITAVIVTALALFAMIWIGVPLRFGAHPWWADKVVWIGLAVGVLLGLLLHFVPLPKLRRLLGLAALLALACTATWYGKTQFAASYAQDALAGKFWYFGWIGISTSFAALVFTIANR